MIAGPSYKSTPSHLPIQLNMDMLLRIVEKHRLETVLHVYPTETVELGAQLGSGGFACVYEGMLKLSEDVGKREIAVKVPIKESTGEELASFLKEARVALTATGVHVCQLLGVTVYDGRPCFLLPRYDDNVHDLVNDEYPGGLPVWLALKTIRRVANGIFDMHTKGIVHLDLKPLNILVNGDFEEIVVSDFGLSTSYSSTLRKADMGAASGVGTVPYMSPEQFDRGTFGNPGPKSDVWALGCVFIQLLTNKVPHVGKSRNKVKGDLVNRRVPPPIPPSLPPDVAQFVKSLLQIEPRDRPTSAEVMERLDRLVARHLQPL